MNELVNKLAEQAESKVSWGDPNNHDERSRAFDEWQEKFAESIVRECMDICDEVTLQFGQFTFTAATAKARIAHRFGLDNKN